jgi:hypothetical protein
MQQPPYMSQPPSGPPYNYQGPQDFGADKVVGILIMVLYSCASIFGLLALLALSAASGQVTERVTPALTALALALVVISVGLIITGYFIMKGAKGGFIAGAIVFGLSTVGNLFQLGDPKRIIGTILGVAAFVYCVARLTGSLGPKPT